ncbi:MAG: AAA family ATPase [Deltaproteobacteria bacterium]|jgi:Cdc6-like AAA superfamily ATPase|nr:AAA family ATPase [Deltaproteobacteria bacterium]
MTLQLPTLPVGWQLFEKLRQKKAVYVDKTQYLPMLREAGDIVFCSRPRRFGKSLTVHALDAYHSGRTELFRGLAAERHMSSPDFTARPVIRLDMNRVAGSDSLEILEMKIKDVLGDNAKRHKVSLNWTDSAGALFSILRDVHEVKGKKVVLLIDEYDAPIIKLIERERIVFNELLLAKTRLVIREFYSQIKSAEEHIEFVFITGVTKLSRMGMFSLLNNLIDISLRPEFASFMGYTQKELEDYFAPFILNIVGKRGKDEKYLLDAIRDYYDGFSFDGKTMLYCPFSILSFFADVQSFIADGQFANY